MNRNPIALTWGAVARRIALLLLALPALASATRIESGHSAMWINPSRAGEGWVLEIMANDKAALYWYTADDEGAPRWIIGTGNIVRGEDDKIVFTRLVTGHGGRFANDVPASDVTLVGVGNAEMRFSDCNHGKISFDAYGKEATYPLIRLSRTMGAGCSPVGGIPGEAIQPYAGVSGTWFDPESGGGPVFTLQWLADGRAFLFWFAYDPEGHPFWVGGHGRYEDGMAVFPNLYSVHGVNFSEDHPPEQAELVPWGEVELHFSCDEATASYNATAQGYGFGTFHLKPLTRLAKPACPYVKPKLTDLYDLEWTALPVPRYETPLSDVNFRMYSIADDGTVVGEGAWNGWSGVVRLRPGETEWEKMLEGGREPFIAPDGETVFAFRVIAAPPEDADRSIYFQPMMWREADGWQPLPRTIFVSNAVRGISQNGKWLVGNGMLPNDGRAYPWKWSEETGQVRLELDWRGGNPLGISNDGEIAVGAFSTFTDLAMMWASGVSRFLFDGNDVQLGLARTCDANCSLVAGFHQYPMDTYPDSYLAWYMQRSTGVVTYLDMPEGAEDNNIVAMNSQGNLFVGDMAIWEEDRSRYFYEGWLWMQDIGSVSMRNILEGRGEFQFTDRWSRQIADVSSDGTRILFTGVVPSSFNVLPQYRAGVLRLIPKASVDAFHQP